MIEALCIAYQDSARFRIVLRNLSAVIFFSSPHSQRGSPSDWETLPIILKAFSKSKSKAKIEVTPELATGLSKDALRFEHVVEQIPIMSFYETLKTRTKTGVGGVFAPKILVSTALPAGENS
jgi:hypothetical protein